MTSTADLAESANRNVRSRLAGKLAAPIGSHDIVRGDVVLVVLATILGFLSATTHGVKPAGGTVAGLAMVLIGVAVLARRPAPIFGLVAVLAADLLNIAVFGEHTRCAVVLPVSGYLAFVASRRAVKLSVILRIIAVTAAIGVVTCAFELGPGGIVPCVLIFVGVVVAGQVVRRHDLVAGDLDRETRALEAQRDQTARLAVESERARIGGDIGGAVEQHVATLLDHARAARTPQADAAAVFSAIEQESRAGLTHMRAVLDDLSPTTVTPQPSLAELDALIAAGRERAVLHFDGERRPLAPGVELAACRIIELLLGVADPTDARVQIRVGFTGEALEIDFTSVAGDVTLDQGILAAAQARAAAVGGSIDLRAHGAQTQARIWLPALAGA